MKWEAQQIQELEVIDQSNNDSVDFVSILLEAIEPEQLAATLMRIIGDFAKSYDQEQFDSVIPFSMRQWYQREKNREALAIINTLLGNGWINKQQWHTLQEAITGISEEF